MVISQAYSHFSNVGWVVLTTRKEQDCIFGTEVKTSAEERPDMEIQSCTSPIKNVIKHVWQNETKVKCRISLSIITTSPVCDITLADFMSKCSCNIFPWKGDTVFIVDMRSVAYIPSYFTQLTELISSALTQEERKSNTNRETYWIGQFVLGFPQSFQNRYLK
jgi:hypothetical protein